MSAGQLHADFLLSQREMEKPHPKEHQLSCERDHTSTYMSNQLRLAGFLFAYALMQKREERQLLSSSKQSWQPRCGSTIRLKLLKGGSPNHINCSTGGDCYQFLLDWTIFCSRCQQLQQASFGIICHFCDNTYFGD